MKIVITNHAKQSAKDRGFTFKIMREVIVNPDFVYFDLEQGCIVAVKKMYHCGKIRNICVPFHHEGIDAKIHTIHAAKKNEVANRIKSGRYELYEESKNI